MEFTWGDSKAVLNRKKHRVSFEEAQTVFEDCGSLKIFYPDHSEDEDRVLCRGISSILCLLVV